MMKSIENAAGVMMKGNTPVLKFELLNGFLGEFKIIDKTMLPLDFELNHSAEDAFMIFLQERIVSPERIHINSDVKKIGMKYYDPDSLFHFTHGRSIEDDYWFKFEDDSDSLTYEELVQRLNSAGHSGACY